MVEEALRRAEALFQPESSRSYFLYHRQRYKDMALHIATRHGGFQGLRVLDIGSHLLHFATVLKQLGAEPVGIDVPVFTELREIQLLAQQLGITNHTIVDLETDLHQFLQKKSYDLIVFSEILEHITFNPRQMWNAMLAAIPKGSILLSTPNAFTLHKVPGYLARMFSLSGYGIKVEEILSVPTYGHHWKEYSVSELHRYFLLLGPHFKAEVFTVPGCDAFQGPPLARALRSLLIGISNCIPLLRFQIFCWVEPR